MCASDRTAIESDCSQITTEDLKSSSGSSTGNLLQHMPKVKIMCSYGGRILPKPDGHLRYVGGETRIVVVSRGCSYARLAEKLSKLCQSACLLVKYQLPKEDLDALVSVTCDEDVANMMDEYDRMGSAKLRVFLFLESPTPSFYVGETLSPPWSPPLRRKGLKISPSVSPRGEPARSRDPPYCTNPNLQYYQPQTSYKHHPRQGIDCCGSSSSKCSYLPQRHALPKPTFYVNSRHTCAKEQLPASR